LDIEKIIAEVLRRLETEIVSNAAGKRDDESKAKVLLISKERSRGHHLSEKINTLQAHYSIQNRVCVDSYGCCNYFVLRLNFLLYS
jgi:hypothetical protein